MRVLVFSYIRLFSDALAECLNTSASITDVKTCNMADQLINVVLDYAPDILLVDVTNNNALNEARAVSSSSPETPILAVALAEVADDVIACADAGLVGYVPRQASLSDLITIMHRSLNGESVCDPKIANSLFREIHRRQKPDSTLTTCEPLTKRESEVLASVSQGLSNKEIARNLNLSVATIKNHLHNIFTKLNVHSRAEATSLLRNDPWLAYTA